MAYLFDVDLSFTTSAASPYTLTMPSHATNDILVAIVSEDGTGTLAMTGWTQIGTTLAGSTSSHASAVFYVVATSSAMTGAVTMGTPDALSAIVLTLRDVDVSTIATTAAAGTGTVVTMTFANQGSTPYPAGTIIKVAGVTPAGYNGTYVSTGGSSTTVTHAGATTGNQTVAGTITAQVDNSTQVAVAAASQFSSVALTTNTSDTFILYAVAMNGIAPMVHTDPGPAMFIYSLDSTGTTATTSCGTAAAWYQQRIAGSTPTPSWTTGTSDDNNKYTISFRNKSSGIIPAYIDEVTSPGTALYGCHYGAAGTAFNGVTPTTSLPYANIGPNGAGLTAVYDALALTADYGINPYSSAQATTPAAQAAGTSAGFVLTFTATKDFSTGFVMGSVIAANPKMANFNLGSINQGGVFISFGDASNYYRSYQIFARDSKPSIEGRQVFSIQPATTTSRYGYSANALNTAAIKSIMFLSNCPTATITLYVVEIHLVKTQVIAGGCSAAPVDTDGVSKVGSSFRLPVIQKIGASGLLAYAPIQVGGGDAVNFQIDAGSLQFPRRYNTTTGEINFHASDDNIGIDYAGKSGDVIKHTNSVITSPSQYYWRINASATNAASWDFSGLVIIGATVTLRNIMVFLSMIFSSYFTITANDCHLNDCKINKVPASNDSLIINSNTLIENSMIDVTGVTAGNRLCSITNPTIFSKCTFTGSGSSGHAIRLTSTGSFTLDTMVFNSFGANGSTSAAILNESGGLITITITGTTVVPTYKNISAATTVLIVNPVNITIVVKNLATPPVAIQNAIVLILAAAGGPMPYNITVTITNSGTTATVTHSSHGMNNGDKVQILGASLQANNGVFTIAYINVNSYSYTMGSTPGSNPTGTIKATYTALYGLTDVNGTITMSRVFSSNQPITGRIRKSTGSPIYKTSSISDTVNSTTGFSTTILMVSDE